MGFFGPAAGARPGGDREAVGPSRAERRGRTQGVRDLQEELLRRYFSGEVAHRRGCGLGLHRLPRPRGSASERGGVEAQDKREREEVPSLLQESPQQQSDSEYTESRELHFKNRLKGATRREDRKKGLRDTRCCEGQPRPGGKEANLDCRRGPLPRLPGYRGGRHAAAHRRRSRGHADNNTKTKLGDIHGSQGEPEGLYPLSEGSFLQKNLTLPL